MADLHIVGLGVGSISDIAEESLFTIRTADVIIGSTRHLQLVASVTQTSQCVELPKLAELKLLLQSLLVPSSDAAVDNIVVLASGDPLFYGIGRWLGKTFSTQKLFYYPAVSSLQATCHQLGLSLQDVDVVSLHGRPLHSLRAKLKRSQTLLILTDKNSHPLALAQECVHAGFSRSLITVCERLGYNDQKVREFPAEQLLTGELTKDSFAELHVSVIKTRGEGGYLPEFPGIADEHFITDSERGKGLITKREVRLSILSLLQIANGDVVWDVGAGCGGVAIEMAYWAENADIIAIEHHPQRFDCLQKNQQRFGVVKNLRLKNTRAPAVFGELLEQGLEPNKIFIGGSDGELADMLQRSWALLPLGGVLVATAVTETSKMHLFHFSMLLRERHAAYFETLQVAVSRGGELAGQLIYRPNLAVTLFKWTKKTTENVQDTPISEQI